MSATILTQDQADYIEDKYNVIVDIGSGYMKVGGSIEDTYGWEDIPAEWIEEAKIKENVMEKSKLYISFEKEVLSQLKGYNEVCVEDIVSGINEVDIGYPEVEVILETLLEEEKVTTEDGNYWSLKK